MDHRSPQLGELWQGLGGRADVVDLDARHGEADQGSRRRHAVIVVRAPNAGMQRARHDTDAVREFVRLTAESAQLPDEGGDAIGLVTADVPDAVEHALTVGEGRETEDRRGELARGRKVEFDAVVRIDTPGEAEYYRNGGILQFVLRNMLKS